MVDDHSNTLGRDLSVALLEDGLDLEACQNEWEQLLDRSATNGPMLSHFWMLAWWRTFGSTDGRKLRLWTFRDRDRLVGVVPMALRCHRHFGIVPMPRLELLANGEREHDEIMSEYLAPIVAAGYEHAVAEAFVRQLAANSSDWQEVVMTELDGSSLSVAALQPALQRQKWPWQQTLRSQCRYVELPDSWETYLSLLKSSSRRFVNKSLREFEAWAGDSYRVERVATADDLGRGLAILIRLHQQRWRKSGKPGAFSSRLFLQFHEQVMPKLLERKALDLCWLSVRGEPVAANYNIIWRNRVYYYQGGRSLDVPKGIRPAVVLHLLAIKQAIEEAREEYDFLGGDAPYKRKLAPSTRPLVGVRITQPCLAEAARILLDQGRSVLREFKRKFHGTGSSPHADGPGKHSPEE
jgi:CelD/BcsL family acetyltransferase involved in cellulose biosynthesis